MTNYTVIWRLWIIHHEIRIPSLNNQDDSWKVITFPRKVCVFRCPFPWIQDTKTHRMTRSIWMYSTSVICFGKKKCNVRKELDMGPPLRYVLMVGEFTQGLHIERQGKQHILRRCQGSNMDETCWVDSLCKLQVFYRMQMARWWVIWCSHFWTHEY